MSIGLVFEAAICATERHLGQKRGGRGRPYVLHTIEVARLVAHYGFTSDETLAAALLHDVVEDTYDDPTKGLAEVSLCFGPRVAELVGWMTLPPEYQKDFDRKLKHQVEMMRKMDDDGRAIKIADKFSNVRDLLDDPPAWSARAKLSYAQHSLKVVEAAVACTHDVRILAMGNVFYGTHHRLQQALRA